MFFGSSECESVKIYVELAEPGGDCICEKPWECYAVESDGTRAYPIKEFKSLSLPSHYIEKLRADDIIPLVEIETLKHYSIETRPQYTRDMYIGDTYIPERMFQSEGKLVEWILITLDS